MDIKIGAVFSLADINKAHKPLPVQVIDSTSGQQTVGGQLAGDHIEEDDIEYFIPNDEKMQATINEVSTDSATSDVLDQDCPPSLSMETTVPTVDVTWQEDRLPPVLEPEKHDGVAVSDNRGVSLESAGKGKRKQPTRRKCTRIFPSYLVLTNIAKVMEHKERISYRKLKRVFRECTNMCKKIYFRRRLEAGNDVFCVRTPSKNASSMYSQKLVFTISGQKGPKSKRPLMKNPEGQVRQSDIPLNTGKSNKGEKATAARVSRTVQFIPKDFQTEDYQEKIMKQIHNKEMINLRAQIRMKRHANKYSKRIRKMEEKTVSHATAVGTSSKGRQRRSNPRYGAEFACTNQHMDLQPYMAMAKLERKFEKEQKRMKEGLKHLKRRMSSVQSAKKSPDFEIDNPEENMVKKIKLEETESQTKSRDNKLKLKLNTGSRKQSRRGSRGGIRKDTKKAEIGDGVLIRDLPNENQYISGILGYDRQETITIPAIRVAEAFEGTDFDINSYSHAKSLLKASKIAQKSLTTKSSEIGRLLGKRCDFSMNPELVKEKARVLKIPESVQKLFQVKTEPVDNSYEQFANVPLSSSTLTLGSTPPVASSIPGSNITRTSITQLPKRVVFPVALATKSPGKTPLVSIAPRGPLLVRAGGVSVPATLKAGTNRDQLMSLLVTSPTAMTKAQLPTSSVGNTISLIKTSALPSASQPSFSPKIVHVMAPGKTAANTQTVTMNVPLLNPLPSKSLLNNTTGSQTVMPQVLKLSPVQLSKQTGPTPIPGKQGQTLAGPGPTKINFAKPIQSSGARTNPPPGAPVIVQPPRTMSVVSTSQPQVTPSQNETCRFYLLKVDGKNILIPMNNNNPSVPPTAFVVNSSVSLPQPISSSKGIVTMATTGANSIQAPTPTLTKLLVSSPVIGSSAVPTMSDEGAVNKPTAAITPSVKPSTGNGYETTKASSQSVIKPAGIPTTVTKESVLNSEQKLGATKNVPNGDVIVEFRGGTMIMRSVNEVTDASKTLKNISSDIKENAHAPQKNPERNLQSSGRSAGSIMAMEDSKVTEKKAIQDTATVELKYQQPFSEGVSDREEKLRKLKELLKEKQKAVDAIRANRQKN